MMDVWGFGKVLMVIGAILLGLGLWITFGPQIPFLGQLPGDIYVERKGFRFSFPVVTCLVVSVIATLVLNVFFKK
jgi:hypothetical protein